MFYLYVEGIATLALNDGVERTQGVDNGWTCIVLSIQWDYGGQRRFNCWWILGIHTTTSWVGIRDRNAEAKCWCCRFHISAESTMERTRSGASKLC